MHCWGGFLEFQGCLRFSVWTLCFTDDIYIAHELARVFHVLYKIEMLKILESYCHGDEVLIYK